MKENYHKREHYEQLLNTLKISVGDSIVKLDNLSDFQLLLELNKYLSKLNCIPYTKEEIMSISECME